MSIDIKLIIQSCVLYFKTIFVSLSPLLQPYFRPSFALTWSLNGLLNGLLASYITLLQSVYHSPTRVIVFLPGLTYFIVCITTWRIKPKFFLMAHKTLTLSLVLSLSPSQIELFLYPRFHNPMCLVTLNYLFRIYFANVCISAKNLTGNK